jgi:hypothetical protein
MDINGPGTPGGHEAALGQTAIDIRHLSASQLAQLGVSELAYVKPVLMNGALAYAIHSADGTPMALAPQLDLAMTAIRQHEMVPMLVH